MSEEKLAVREVARYAGGLHFRAAEPEHGARVLRKPAFPARAAAHRSRMLRPGCAAGKPPGRPVVRDCS